jgi:TPR repeat protein
MRRTFALALVSLGATFAAEAAPPTVDAPERNGINVCAFGMEQILPGDYYACRAVYAMQHRDYRKAVDLLQESASWANKNSQRVLGLVYFNGDSTGIRPNHPLGLAWLKLAAERHDPVIQKDFDAALARASQDEQAESARLFQSLKDTYGDEVAGKRAVQRYNEYVIPIKQASLQRNYVVLYGFGPYGQRADVVVAQLQTQAQQDFSGLVGNVVVGAVDSDPGGEGKPAPPK